MSHPWPRADRPFSNSTDGEIWTSAWCDTCIWDLGADQHPENGCPILLNLLMHQPDEHIRTAPVRSGQVGPSVTICTNYQPIPVDLP